MMIHALSILLLAQTVAAHSWVECVSYDPPSFDYKTLGAYDRSRCSGYPRDFSRQFVAGFGVDTGYNWAKNSCPPHVPENTNNDLIPMAKYVMGQTIYISHPSKNHVADTCTNPFIPSHSLKLMMSSTAGLDSFDISLVMVGSEHVNGEIDHNGYQRCFDFCGNMDKAHCLTAWVVPSTVPEGKYSFMWSWQFNENEFYSSCFDAQLVLSNNVSSPISSPSPSEVPTPSPSTLAPEMPSTYGSSGSESVHNPSPSASSGSESSHSTNDTVEPPAEVPSSTRRPDIISSSAPALSSPISQLRSYIENISGSFNISIVVNSTIVDMQDVIRRLRSL